MPKESFPTLSGANNDPAKHMKLLVPSNSLDLEVFSRALYCGTAGNIAVQTAGGESLTIPVLAGLVLPLSIGRLLVTGTTATQIYSMW